MQDIKDSTQHLDIDWYRVPLEKSVLQELNRRSNTKGLLQAIGHLALLVLTGGLAIYAVGRGPWSWILVPVLVFLHGSFFHFLLNGFHELSHSTVFESRALNDFFLKLYSLLGFWHYATFQQSHRRHHRYTLHDPYDSEVILPIRYELIPILKAVFVDFRSYWIYREYFQLARGIIDNPWYQKLFPPSKPELRRELFGWARFTLLFHAALLVLSLWLAITLHPRWLLLPILVTFARFYARALNFLLNDTQHIGLTSHVPDFRLCARSIRINPFFGFLYWQMQYHIEHHMYAAVPFYNLPRLNRLIRHALPEPPNGVLAAWLHINRILQKQKQDPNYTYQPPLPQPAHP